MPDGRPSEAEILARRDCPYCDGDAVPCPDGVRARCLACGRAWTAKAWDKFDHFQPGYRRDE